MAMQYIHNSISSHFPLAFSTRGGDDSTSLHALGEDLGEIRVVMEEGKPCSPWRGKNGDI